MNRLLSFLFQNNDSPDLIIELIRAVRVLSERNVRAMIVVDLNSFIEKENQTIDAIELANQFINKKRESIVIRYKKIVDFNITPPFPANVHYHNLSNGELACLGISQNTGQISLYIDDNGKISLAYQNSIKLDLKSTQVEKIIKAIIKPSGSQAEVLAVSSS